ncbi:Uncharacterized protein K02A2.6 [Eumeta japonica]|uniref:RNA-directed DNA polymerase n=1 Tax=Eumeta variegata TaxID=151549 RepID=A0A4C1S9C4_EUMVA|nr:Uncharacterized protein K02A2.6 [Eumeta japonica]
MPVTLHEIREGTMKDPDLQKLYLEIQSGRTDPKKLHEFSLQNNCIFYGIRIVIPKALQNRILEELHTAHTGMVKMKALARSYVWWKNIDSDIERMVKECKDCCLMQKNPVKVPVHIWEYPKEPWSRIHIDYAGPYLNNYFLIVVDAYTKWLEVVPTASITAAATVNILKKIYTTFGLPITQVSDNGRQFRSQEMLQFLKENGIQAKFTAPFHPSSNGQAERCGKLHYEIEVDGKIHHRHVDQIIKTYCVSDNQYPPDTYQFNPMQPRETVQSCEGTKELQQEQEPTLPTVVPTEPTNTNMYLPSPIAVRRPQRIRKVPDRLNL